MYLQEKQAGSCYFTTLEFVSLCLHCLQKCDGQKPACGTCIRSGKREDCEYADGHGPTTTQLLEEDISRLQERIDELENPDDGSTLKLFHPYQVAGSASRR